MNELLYNHYASTARPLDGLASKSVPACPFHEPWFGRMTTRSCSSKSLFKVYPRTTAFLDEYLAYALCIRCRVVCSHLEASG